MSEPKPCPFCGTTPDPFMYGAGTCLDYGCDDCGMAYNSIQLCDLMTIEERVASRDLTPENGYAYEPKYAERAEAKALEYWNTRA